MVTMTEALARPSSKRVIRPKTLTQHTLFTVAFIGKHQCVFSLEVFTKLPLSASDFHQRWGVVCVRAYIYNNPKVTAHGVVRNVI